MRYIIFVSLLFSLNIKAQTILTAGNNAPWPIGETYVISLHDTVTALPKNTGAAQIWNFSNLIPKGLTQTIQYTYPINLPCTSYLNSPPPQNYETNIALGGYNTTWQGFNWEIVGYTDLSHSIKFTNYATIYKWPVAFGYNEFDTFSGSTATPTTCSPANEVMTGTLITQAPGEGTILLPGSITYPNCLQVVKTQTTVETMSTSVNTTYETEYKYYHSSQKWPIVEIFYAKYVSGSFSYSFAIIGINNALLGTDVNPLPNKEVDVNLFPNPAKEFLLLNIPESSQTFFNYTIFSVTGSSLINGRCKTKDPIDVSVLNDGIYFIEINTSEGIVRRKFVKD